MPVRTLIGLVSILAAVVLSLSVPSPASAEVVNGCDYHANKRSAACMAFDSNGDGFVFPVVTIAWPASAPVQVGTSITVAATGVDLLRPVTIGLHRVTSDDDDPTPANVLANITLTPGALTSSVTVPITSAAPLNLIAYVDEYETVGVYAYDVFSVAVAALPSSLTSDLPPGRVVKVGAKAQTVSGRVSGGARPVDLQVRAKDGAWVSVASTTSAANGTYSIGVPTFWVGKHTYRAFAPEHGTFGAAEGTKSSNLTVKRSYKPQGSKARTFLFGRARWNACAPIRYGVNTSKMPKWARAEIRYALREVSAATGLRFTSGTATSHVPFARKRTEFPESLDLVFAFSTPKQVPGLIGSTIGLGGASFSGNVVFDGGVTLDVSQKASKKVWREIVLHEVGHAIGLGHVSDRRQVMVSGSTGKNTRYGKGDLAGLAAVGAGAGACTGEKPSYLRGAGARRVADTAVHQVVVP